ncbi:MAG: hypothetical protein ACK4PK_00990 [Alphaproteobacteria bacterium]
MNTNRKKLSLNPIPSFDTAAKAPAEAKTAEKEDYKLLNQHTLLRETADGNTDYTVVFNFVSPSRIIANTTQQNRGTLETHVSTKTIDLQDAPEPEDFLKLQKILAKYGGAPLGGFAIENQTPSAPSPRPPSGPRWYF